MQAIFTPRLSASGDPLLSRDVIDAARGIGIAFVVFGHINPIGPLVINAYGFHMPLFFFLSGMTLRREPPILSLIMRDSRALLLYAVLHFGILAALTRAVFQPAGMAIAASSPLDWRTYFLWPVTRNSEHVHLFVIGWFILALFLARPMSALILKAASRLPPVPATVLILGIALLGARTGVHFFAFAATKAWPWNLLSHVAVATAFCLFGYLTQNPLARFLRPVLNAVPSPLAAALFLYAALVVLRLSPFIMSLSQYPGGTIATLVHSGLGIAMVICLAKALSTSRWTRLMGRRSKTIMTWHLTAAATINLVLVELGYLEAGNVNVFTIFDVGRSWPIYLFAGLIGPLLAALAAERAFAAAGAFVQARTGVDVLRLTTFTPARPRSDRGTPRPL
ncbi:acyltransferase [Aurantimonas sp. VKM B-3413]|uniref:acyltransferase family protein n=1 Tax=Aurantimonas sp. VKM B-3413 TaxID=2779401 RepID=UPI001E626266|nr:acyltransferase [Aurantimonas sp. VKM B-3413]MCB8839380.1 acyltransferase family protein [Aurantimonas sp. VKM B-3413]